MAFKKPDQEYTGSFPCYIKGSKLRASVFKIKNPQTTQEYGYTVHFINLWLGTQA